MINSRHEFTGGGRASTNTYQHNAETITNTLNQALAEEYRRWQFGQQLRAVRRHDRYDVALQFMIQIMSNENCAPSDQIPQDPVYKILPDNHSVFAGMAGFTKGDEEYPKHIKRLVDEFITHPPKLIKLPQPTFADGIYEVAEFARYVRPELETQLKIAASDYGLTSTQTRLAITIMLMRYDIIAEYYQWNTPRAVYDVLFNAGFVLEGFASPLDSQMLGRAKYTKYCSLYYDTDKYFGSLGPIQRVDYINIAAHDPSADSPLCGIVLSTPRIYELVELSKDIYKKCTEAKIPCIFIEHKLDILNEESAKTECSNVDEPFDWFSETSTRYRRIRIYESMPPSGLCIHCNDPIIWKQIGAKVREHFRVITNVNDPEYISLHAKIHREYSRWCVVQQILNLSNDNSAIARDWRTAVNWLLGEMSRRPRDRNWVDYVFAANVGDLYAQMQDRLVAHPDTIVTSLIHKTAVMIADWLEQESHPAQNLKYGLNRQGLYCGEFKLYIGSNRERALINMLFANGYCNYVDMIILILYLRYSCIFLEPELEIKDPREFFKKAAKSGIALEFTQSPIRAMLPLYNPKARFCSQFYDTDYYFGSLGRADEFVPNADIRAVCSIELPISLIDKWRADCKKNKCRLKIMNINAEKVSIIGI